MVDFDFSQHCQSLNSSESLEEKLLETEKYLSLQLDFIEFQNWSSEDKGFVQNDKKSCRDISPETDFSREQGFDDGELAQLFTMDELLNDDDLSNELALLETYLADSPTILVTCPKNMPQWKNAWWGERVLNELG